MSITRTTRAGRVASAFAALLLGATLVAGCGSSDEPEPQQSRQNADEPDDDPERPEQDDRAEGDKKDEPAPEPEEYKVAKQYMNATSTAMKSGDVSELLELGTDDCRACKVMADTQTEIHETGGKYIGDPSYGDFRLVQGPEKAERDLIWVRIAATQAKHKLKKADWKAPAEFGGIEEVTDIGLVEKQGTWKVAEACGVTESQPFYGCPQG